MHPIFHAIHAVRRNALMSGGFGPGACQGDASGETGEESTRHFSHRGFFGGGHWGGPWSGGPPGFPHHPHGRRGRVRRGDVRTAILALLAEQPRNGYQLIQEISDRSGGVWKPSPGSIYPALQQLEDEGLVRAEDHEGKKVFALSEAGEAYLREKPQEGALPWEGLTDPIPEAMQDYQALLGQVMAAGSMLAQAADPAQLEKARQLLNQTRKGLYQILAEDGEDGR